MKSYNFSDNNKDFNRCSNKYKKVYFYSLVVILFFIAAVFYFNDQSSHEIQLFKRSNDNKTKINGQKRFSLKEDYNGNLYYSRKGTTFPYFSYETSFFIKNDFIGDVGVYFTVFSKTKDELEVFKKSSKSSDVSLLLKRIHLNEGINEIFFSRKVKKGEGFFVRGQKNKKFIVSIPISYLIKPPSKRELVFMISVDTLSALHMSLYGYHRKTTPNMDNFSRDAVVFSNAYSNSSWTASSHMSLFSSLLEHQHRVVIAKDYKKKGDNNYDGVKRYVFPLSTSIPFLVENISKDFITISLNGGANVSANFGFFRGFDLYMSNMDDLHNSHASKILFDKTRKNLLDYSFPKAFYFLHTYHVHTPYNPEKAYIESIDKTNGMKMFDLNQYRGHRDIFRPFSNEFVNDVKSLYDAEVLSFDKAFGDFITFLKSSNIYDNAIIILFSDHGEEFQEHGSWEHATHLYNEQIKIPLIMKFPDQQFQGKIIYENVSLLDVMPTLLDFLDIDIHQSVTGKSLMGIITGNKNNINERFVVSSIFRSKPFSFLPGKIALMHKGFKLIYNESFSEKTCSYFFFDPPFISKYELYDLEKDKREKNNLFVDISKSKQNQKMFKTLVKLVKQMKKNKISLNDRKKVKIPEELVKQLKSLGYLE